MKKIYPLLLICAATTSYAQVGFGTSNPDPNSVIELKATNKGLLMPRIALTSTNLASPLLVHVKGMTIYNTANTGSGTTAVTEGVYYNDGTQWIKMITDTTEPFNIESTTTKATTNTQNIYQNGNVGIGDFSVTNPIAKLDVRGAVRGGTGNAGAIGTNSVTFGTGNTASEPNTVATGINNTASGVNAVSMGGGSGTVNDDGGNTSSGDMSFSFGTGNISSGTNSHTMGDVNNAQGYASFAGGQGSQSDDYAFAWGSGNRSALGAASFGYLNFADGYSSFVAGGFNATSAAGSAVFGSSNIFRDGSPTTQVATDAGFQLGNSGLDDVGYNGYSPTHNAFTILKNGYTAIGTHTTKPVHTIEVNGDAQIKTLTTGDITTDNIVVADAGGVLKTVAPSSVGIEPWQIQTTTDKATSNSDNIYQTGSVAIGKNEVLAGAALDVAGALRVGSGNTGSVGGNSTAIGTDITVSGGNSVGIGNQNTVSSSNTLVVGNSNTAIGTGTANAIFGSNNIQTTEGGGPAYNNNTIFGDTNKITTEGGGGAVLNNTLFGRNNIMTAAGGGSNQANNTIFGQNNTLSAEGSGTTQLNNTLFGNNNNARISANNSTIFGENNISNSYNQFIIGKANTNVDNSLFEIGMGADASNRANALTVIANGNVGIANEATTPTEKLDVGSGNVRVRDINTNTGADTDNIVVADATGVLKTVASSNLAIEPWQIVTTTDKATLNTNNIYQMGNVAIQKNTPTAGVTLDVEGAVRGGTGHTSSVGINSVAFGSGNEASGDNSVAFGSGNYATWTNAVAFGGYNTASGQYSAAFGQSNTASGFFSVVFGHSNQATTFNTAAFGENTVASGQKSTAFGQNSTADGLVATAFGVFTKASGTSATSFGNGTQAIGTNSTTFGNNSIASGDNSASFGSISTASGEMATTFGYNTFAIGKASTTFGDQTRAPSRLEFSIGGGNAFITAVDPVGWNDADALFQIGNYNSLVGGARTNAMTVLKDGKVGIGGKHTVKPSENLDVMMGNARVRDINTVTGASTDKIVVADATGILKTIASSTVALEPWQIASTTNKATANTDNIYQMGNVGIGVNAPNSTLQVVGSLSANIRTEAGDFTLGNNDYTVVLDAATTDAVYNATIPTADATNKGRIYHLVLSSSNSLNLTGAAVYQGAFTRNTMYYYQISALTIQSTGTKWVVLQ